MKNIYSLSILLTSIGLMLTFVIIPILVKHQSFESIIYLGKISNEIILYNFINILFFHLFATIIRPNFKQQQRQQIKIKSRLGLIYYSSILVLIWIFLYIGYGGLNYREVDVNLGYESRGAILNFVLSLYNVILILVLSIIIRIKYSKGFGKFLGLASIIFFIFVIVLTGSRGVLIQLILSSVFLFFIKKEILFKGQRNTNIFFRFFTIKNILFFSVLIFLFGLIGYFRDNQSDFYFQLLFRLSEPYWNMALEFSKQYGGNAMVLYDSFDRIFHILLTHFGYTIEGSIEGSDYYLDKYIGIPFTEGASLPITLFGFGFLIDSFYGVSLVLIFTAILIRMSFSLNVFFSKHILWNEEFIVTFATSCLLIYSKSYSGVFQILIYEKFTTFIVLLFFTYIWLFLRKSNI